MLPSVIVVGSYAVGLTMRTGRFPVPGETTLGSGFDEGPGGKGSNQAIGVARLGAPARLVACLGQDRFADAALALYRAERVDARHVRAIKGTTTGVGFIVVDARGENLIVLDPGANALLDVAAVERVESEISTGDVVLTQLEIAEEPARAAMMAGRRRGARTILNPAPARRLAAASLASVDVLTPNETELRILLGREPDDPTDDAELARELLRQGVGVVVVTRGAAGALVVEPSGTRDVAAPRVAVVESTGAGDAFNAALAASLVGGITLTAAVERAVVAGALACTRRGVVASLPTRDELDRMLSLVH